MLKFSHEKAMMKYICFCYKQNCVCIKCDFILFCICSGEEEAMDHQVSPEPENGQSEEGEEEEEEEETSDLEHGPKGNSAKQCTSPPRLFTFSMVNSYGTANISPLPCDGNVLKLNSRSTLFNLKWKTLTFMLKVKFMKNRITMMPCA